MDLDKEHFCHRFEKSNIRYHTIKLITINKTGNARNTQHRGTFVYLLGYPNSLKPFHLQWAILWRFYVAEINKPYVGLGVKCPTFLSHFKQKQIFSINADKSRQYQTSWESSQR